ncbi:MAG TPA: glucosamine-6-phosphate deaminase [Pyrinomonadaceae bacterium]|nr:glucosamine-6-phosphate deaminase [Pyrinomonadaceae bacterium]
MKTEIFENKLELGRAAADKATEIIERAISERGACYLIAATGASQFEFLDVLVGKPIDWSKVIFFHLDEYVGLPAEHPASFRRYLKERIINRVRPKAFHLIHGEAADPQAECRRVGQLISEQTIDAAFVGIGENGHLAFNDPPADFVTEEPYIVVDLDEACRRQQVGEGWFKTIEQVPRQAISMSIQQIMKAQKVLCIVPDQRKAEAVKSTLEFEVSPLRPASILQTHKSAYLYLDRASASLLNRAT